MFVFCVCLDACLYWLGFVGSLVCFWMGCVIGLFWGLFGLGVACWIGCFDEMGLID